MKMFKLILNFLITLMGIFGPADPVPDDPIPDPIPDPTPIEPPRVDFVFVNPQTVERGEAVEIAWKVTNAKRAWLLVNGDRDRELQLMKGKRKVWLRDSGSLGVVAERGSESVMKKKKITVIEPTPKFMPAWEDLMVERFGSQNVPGEGGLKLGSVQYRYALQSIYNILLHDGTRNPNEALKRKDWTAYKGDPEEPLETPVTRRQVREIITSSESAMTLLKVYFRHKIVKREVILTGGYFMFEMAPIEDWKRDVKVILKAAMEAAKLNGIRGIVNGNTLDSWFVF